MDHTRYMKDILIKEDSASTRGGHLPISGGVLNAGYRFVDAVANICTTAGNLGMKYGKDFIWITQAYDDDMDESVVLMIKDEKYESLLRLALTNDHRIRHYEDGSIKLVKERA